MKARSLVIASLGLLAGCAGVVGITDIHTVDDGPDGTAPAADAGPARGDATTPNDVGTPPIEAGTDAPISAGLRVFITTAETNGAIGSVADADAICLAAANDAKLVGTKWVAWVSTIDANAVDRLSSNGPWTRLDGALVAATKAQLKSGALANAIQLTEHANVLPSQTMVWTGTAADGTISTWNCSSFTTNAAGIYGQVGISDGKNAAWTASDGINGPYLQPCNVSAHLYCFEER